MFNTIVSPQQLRQLLAGDASACCLLDCRFSLADKGYGRRVYAEGHIPGAYYLDLDEDLAAPVVAGSGRHPLPDMARLVARLRGCGVEPDVQVVLYDDCSGAMAARGWWLLRGLGLASVAVLDGGINAWMGEGAVPSVELPAKPVTSEPRWQGCWSGEGVFDAAMVADNLAQASFVLVDARSGERFRGEQEPIDPVAGHVPGALNRPLTDNLQQGRFKSPQQLRDEWSTLLGGRSASQVVHMCGSGVTACHNQLAMEIAGLVGSGLYPGSWSEWIQEPLRPVATGPA
ncbi:sulfurtransferase [Marinobacterium rhizophilum]|uniref:Sulfurtransferase n=1 Tax=Marinobacterium rhizophilum TaxID=420402 RepID=A0ABY5HHR8_9GAMM|nr:sulfurtransferase [Marinobacterium rhizophilum]UTW11907.1 sulfurtransferase [Marinobacterium rhizophilum]